MSDAPNPFAMILRDLEAIQVHIGKVQLALLDVSAGEGGAECDERIQAALIRLEGVQRGVGEVQVMLLRQTAGEEDRPEPPTAGGDDRPATGTAADFPLRPPDPLPVAHPAITPPPPATKSADPSIGPKPPPVATPIGPIVKPSAQEDVCDLKAWLERRGLRVKAVRESSGLDAQADAAALFLGKNYEVLELFFTQVRKRLGGSYFNKWFKSEGFSPEVMSAICQLGHMLHTGGFLAQFRNVKDDKTILFEPLTDGRVTGFLSGGWLERFVFQVAKAAVTEATGKWHDSQALLDVAVALPNGTETELDLLIGLPPDRVLWFECKTGGWQTYVKQFQAVNKGHLKLPLQQATLVLADHLGEAERASATALTSMSVLPLTELPVWLAAALRQ